MSGKRLNVKILIAVLAALTAGSLLLYASTFSTEVRFTSPLATIFKPAPKVTMVVVGDIMLDRNVRNKIDAIGFDAFFAGVKDLLSNADITVGNLEGPFTSYPSKTASLKSKELTFTFDPALAPKLAEIGFDILGLANNHTLNFGKEGMETTKEHIRNADMYYYGDPNNRDSLSIVLERNGIVIGLVGFHEFHYMNFDKVLAEVERIRPQVDFLIVSPHWGPEYEPTPTEKMRELAYAWINAGADAVIGAHPHVIGDIEDYKEKKIFYSLGNFVFDQYFSKETSEGLAVKMVLEKEGDIIIPTYTLTRVEIERNGVIVSE